MCTPVRPARWLHRHTSSGPALTVTVRIRGLNRRFGGRQVSKVLLDSGLHVRATDDRIPTVQFWLSITTILRQFLAIGYEFVIRVHSGRHTNQQRNDHVVVSVSNDTQYPSLQAAAADRRRDLDSNLRCDMIYSFLPVDRDISEFPLILAEWPTEPASCDDQASMVRGA